MATTDERLEQIENALLLLAGGGAGFAAGRLGAVSATSAAARGAGRLALGTPVGRAALAAFTYEQIRDELIARDREIAERELGLAGTILSEVSERTQPIPIPIGGTAVLAKKGAAAVRKRKSTKFNRAVKAGMAAVRKSKSYGKKGTINNAKRAFSAVTKVASKVNRGKKVSAKGVTGTIARAVRKIL